MNDPEKLAELIKTADRLVVKESPIGDSALLFESPDQSDIEALARCLVVQIPEEGVHCMCDGAPAILLYRGDEQVLELTNHHGASVRCSLWDSDVIVANPEKWISWFDVRGMNGPRRELEALQIQEAELQRSWRKWASAMPAGISEAWNPMIEAQGTIDLATLQNALNASIPAHADQVRALFVWNGSGAGPWSGFPSYEEAAEQLLLGYEIPELISAVDPQTATPELIEGAARLFAGFGFFQRHPNGARQLPAELKLAFWNHTKNASDQDKRGRAQRAFAEDDASDP